MLPVKHAGHLAVVVITAENTGEEVSPTRQPVTVYEIMYAKKSAPSPDTPASHKGVGVEFQGGSTPSEITIREMLSGVKDADGNSYFPNCNNKLNTRRTFMQ